MFIQQITAKGKKINAKPMKCEVESNTTQPTAVIASELREAILALRLKFGRNSALKNELTRVLFRGAHLATEPKNDAAVTGWTDREWRQFTDQPWSQAPRWSQFKDWSESRC